MSTNPPKPICAFTVSPQGVAQPLSTLSDPLGAAPGEGYRWYHFDAKDAALEGWLSSVVPMNVAMTLIEPETRPRCDKVADGLLFNLRGVNLNPGANADDMVSVRMWVTDGLIISARLRKIWAIDNIRQGLEAGSGAKNISEFLVDLTSAMTKRIEQVSLDLVEQTDALEELALSPSNTLTSDLAALRQSIIKLRRFVRPQSEAIATFAAGRVWPLDEECASLVLEINNRAVRNIEELDATSDRLKAIQDHLDMLQTSALGRNSYVLSVVAAIFLPLGFLTGLFGINVGGMPGVENSIGFWLVTGGSILCGFMLFFVFRLLKWL